MLFWFFITYFVVFSLYLAITMRNKSKKVKYKKKKKILLILIKVDKGKGGGSPNVDKKFLNVNIIKFEKVNKSEGGGRAPQLFFCPEFYFSTYKLSVKASKSVSS